MANNVAMPGARMNVVALAATPVKGLRLGACSSLRIERDRIAGDRVFYLVDARGRMVNGKLAPGLQALTADYDEREQHLAIGFPGGVSVAAPVELGATVGTRFYSGERDARLVEGPFARALSEHVGFAVRLVVPVDGAAADRGDVGAVSLVSRASLALLARVAGASSVDARRFRMSIELDGAEAHEEDRWVGRKLSVGDARIAVSGHVGRCIVTTRDPDNGAVDLPTLDLLRSYRAEAPTTEPLAFGVFGGVLRAGVVRVGDPVVLER